MTPNELLDVVDEDGKVIESRDRYEVHAHGLLHKEIHVWFFDKDKNIFFQKRGIEKSSSGMLDATVGGHVDSGENFTQAAIRETKEELGIHIECSDLIPVKKFRNISHDFKNKKVNNFLREIFLCKKVLSDSQIIKEVSVKGVDFKKFSFTELDNLKDIEVKKFDQFILTDEIPEVRKFLETR